jgi:hypothetical protein
MNQNLTCYSSRSVHPRGSHALFGVLNNVVCSFIALSERQRLRPKAPTTDGTSHPATSSTTPSTGTKLVVTASLPLSSAIPASTTHHHIIPAARLDN